MNTNEPVAWTKKDTLIFLGNYEFGSITIQVQKQKDDEFDIPLYTHPAQELNAGGEPVKNATYWKRQYNEMSALNDRLKSSLYHANDQIKYLEFHPAKTLTDEEIKQVMVSAIEEQSRQSYKDIFQVFARAILRKANEK